MTPQGILPALAATLLVLTPAGAMATPRVPMVGGDGPETDACGGIGRVFTLEDVLEVREEPDQYARRKGELPPRTLVWLCEGQGEWQGIVYPTGDFQDMGDCRVSTPVAAPRSYDGPCQHGWVMARNLQLVAG